MAMMNPECLFCVFGSQTEVLTQALEHIQTCWEVWKTLKASGILSSDEPHLFARLHMNQNEAKEMFSQLIFAGNFPTDPTDTLLLLYEFEARAKLNDPKVETVLESVLDLENVETKVLETIAGNNPLLHCSIISADISTETDTFSYLQCASIFFFLFAALSMEPPAHFPLLSKKALRVALSLHKKQPQADLDRCRHTHHYSQLIHHSFPQSSH